MNFKFDKFRVSAVAGLASLGMAFVNVPTQAGWFSRFCTGAVSAIVAVGGGAKAIEGLGWLAYDKYGNNTVTGWEDLIGGTVIGITAAATGYQANKTNKIAEKNEKELENIKQRIGMSAPSLYTNMSNISMTNMVPNQNQNLAQFQTPYGKNPYAYGQQSMQMQPYLPR